MNSALRLNGASAFGMTNGARDMDSTPPATTTSASPARMMRAAIATASRPEPHRRLIVAPGTDTGRPASSAAMRATLRLSSPAWFAQPSSTSSIAAGSSEDCAAAARRSARAARSSARTAASAPP